MDAIQAMIAKLNEQAEKLSEAEAMVYRLWLIEISKQHLAVIEQLRQVKNAMEVSLR